MKLTSSLLLAAGAGLVNSSPVEKRAVSDGMLESLAAGCIPMLINLSFSGDPQLCLDP